MYPGWRNNDYQAGVSVAKAFWLEKKQVLLRHRNSSHGNVKLLPKEDVAYMVNWFFNSCKGSTYNWTCHKTSSMEINLALF